jgi:hypothetical protein
MDLLKHSLLLTHGTIYGQLDPLVPVALADKSINIDQWNNPDYDWKAGLFEVRLLDLPTITGTMTDRAPVDLIHWNVAGAAALSPMTPWRNCLKMLTHI